MVALLSVYGAPQFSFVLCGDSELQTACLYHVVQWLQTVFVMLLPALLWSKLRVKDSFASTLFLHKYHHWKLYTLIAVVSIVSLPLLDSLAEICRNLPLPSSIRTMAEEEALTQENLLQQMFLIDGLGGWIELILLMSIATAVGEELTFRGALLACFQRYTKLNKHVVALLVGLIFSIFHFDIYGLIPRWLLGTIFVYLVYYSGSIWPSVFAHALNNLFAILQYKGAI